MNRAARLLGLTEELRLAGDRGRGADWLADRFEVSARTIKRDMMTLQDAGVPIWSASGPGGGYRLLSGGSRPLPAVEFTEAEATAVAVALVAATASPFAVDGRMALTKILRSMPPAAVQSTEALAARVWLRTPTPRRDAAARVLDEAMRARRVVHIDYRDSGGVLTLRRPVEPMFFASTGGDWYLFAWCRLREAGRSFLLDRVQAATLTSEAAREREVREVFPDIPPDAVRLSLEG
ncbi:MAG: WYL domain-containing protein [Dehalococcoidia bacterium]